jgi:hypothetical protein
MKQGNAQTTITFKGQTRTIYQWAKAYGISPNLLRARMHKLNWPAQKALTTPVRKRRTSEEINVPVTPKKTEKITGTTTPQTAGGVEFDERKVIDALQVGVTFIVRDGKAYLQRKEVDGMTITRIK